MRRAIPWLKALLLSVWTAVGLLLCAGLWQARGVPAAATQVVDGAARVTASADATLQAVNAPCTSFHGSATCGTLAQVTQTTKNIGIVAGQSALAARQTGQLVQATAGTLNSMAAQVAQTAAAGRGTLQQATQTLAAVQAKIPQTQALVDGVTQTTADADRTVKDADALMSSAEVQRFLAATAETSVQVSGIATDVHKETTRLTAPQPWYKRAYSGASTGVNVACLVTHSCPF